jgi:hypothetical protein
MAKSLINYMTYKTKNRSTIFGSDSELGRECINYSFAYKDSLYVIYESLRPIGMQSDHDDKPNIIDSPLTLILPQVYPYVEPFTLA